MRLFLVLAVLALAGCAATASEERVAQGNYGERPENYEAVVWAWLDTTLRDSESARVRFVCEPFKAYTRNAPVAGGRPLQFGWLVVAHVNAKNAFGAYTGWEEMRLLINGGEVVARIEENQFFSELWYQDQPLDCP